MSPLFEKLSAVLPKNLRGPVLEHVRTLRELLEGEIEAARKSPDQATKLAAARKITGVCSALCTAVALEPIPLADFPILTTVQVVMIGAIMHVSGRPVSRKAIAEFTGAMGLNVGAGLVLREGARAAAKLLPGFGSMISGAIAGGATFALGRAAGAYFIEGIAKDEVRKLFKKVRKEKPPLALAEK